MLAGVTVIRSLAALLLATACSAGPAVAPPAAPAPAPHQEAPAPEPLGGWVEEYASAIGGDDETAAFHGELLVARGDRVVVHRTFRGAEGQRYRIGSVTKPFTAIAILQLAAAGKLSLEDGIRKHVAELPEAFEAVTLAHLLTHRGGLGSYTQDADLMKRRAERVTRDEMIAHISKEPLEREPGTGWSYSNSGYYLLGLVVERVSGEPWADYLAAHVFEPAKMTETGVTVDRLAPPQSVEGGKIVPAHAIDLSMPYAAGALMSTAADLHRFALALTDDTLLPKPWRERMWQDHGGPHADLGWGYGWMLRDRDGVPTVGHNGAIDGFSSVFEMARDGSAVVVALSNLDAVEAGEVAVPALRMALTGERIEPPEPAAFLPFDAALGAALAGSYALPPEVEAKARAALGDELTDAIRSATLTADGRYVFQPVGQGPVELRLQSDGTLAQPRHRITVTPERRPDGEVEALVLRQGSLTLIYRRSEAAPPELAPRE